MTEFTKITLTAVFSVLGTLIVAVIIATSTGLFREWRTYRDRKRYAAIRGRGLRMVGFNVHITDHDPAQGLAIGFPENWIEGDSQEWRRGLAHDLRVIADDLQEDWEKRQRDRKRP
ncbi:MAG: hypothetical protein OXN92_00010 [Gammaproteobacteria bacterium]|nr:hypothetical protein [Gammaproteobacteria bacterium]